MHPIWYEFLREFISSVGDPDAGTTADNTVIAGAGILGAAAVDTVNVGQGEGLLVSANAVSVDITGQINAQAAAEDEILIADASDASQIRKTSLRDVALLAPGTLPGGINTNIQYNSNDLFAGDPNFTTDGAGTVNISGQLTVDNVTINGSTYSSNSSANALVFDVPAGGLNQFTFTQSGVGSSAFTARFTGLRAASTLEINSDSENVNTTANAAIQFSTNGTNYWGMGLADYDSKNFIFSDSSGLNLNIVYKISAVTYKFTHSTDVIMDAYLLRKTTATITASTTQTQGQQPLTSEINEVSTVANNNDTVTLPTAQTGQKVWVINNGANTLQIFPASGDNLGAGLNTSTTLASGKIVSFIAYDTTNWEMEIDPSSSGYTDEQAQDAVGAMVDTTLVYTDGTPLLSRAALTGDVTASAGSNATLIATPASATVATDDKVLIKDTSAADVMKYVTAVSVRDLTPTAGTTGTGAEVLATSPTLVTPTLGVASATSINFGQDPLNYYDEGNWTPVPFGSTTAGSPTGTFNGRYRRIGNFVTVTCQLVFTSLDTMAGSFRTSGLPFTVLTGAVNRASVSIGFRNNFTNTYALQAFAIENNTELRFYNGEVDNTTLVIGDMSATTNIYLTVSYFT